MSGFPRAVWVYPRVCGGTVKGETRNSARNGLSPRVRGNRLPLTLLEDLRRSIPACAGEPGGAAAPRCLSGVYPRVCGGTFAPGISIPCRSGLSPRVRGNQPVLQAPCFEYRSIPACAGEPTSDTCAVLRERVYPRVCGGTSDAKHSRTSGHGLSPRVRGNRRIGVRLVDCGGSIPACAGEPRQALSLPRRSRVYPRVCGGTACLVSKMTAVPGLSPRVRGNLPVPAAFVLRYGSIPACAGEPGSCSWLAPTSAVYPRVCGGTMPANTRGRSIIGLSPRVRGNLLLMRCSLVSIRSIPACAGEPERHLPASV